ncbi:MAG: alpha/beta fold hydrolase [Flavobacteriaceae bacterium]|nr:alpha/beta fold hydrolase [Flavobacteriaceae bacterium]
MPILKDNTYKPWYVFKNKHFNTIYKKLSPRFKVKYKRERLITPDDDFIDLDIASVHSKRAVIAIHGLEGSAQSSYILSLVHYLNSQDIDVIAFNLRGCSGEPNNKLSTYHSGKTEDLDLVVRHVISHYNYNDINIVGYSLGGNLTLKYMGEYANNLPAKLNRAVAISVPCQLKDVSIQLAKSKNTIYMKAFLISLKAKVLERLKRFPNNNLNKEAILNSKNFYDFDKAYTAPVFGFKDAEDYWHKNSSLHFLAAIKRPTILINALDDLFLLDSCYPFNIAKEHKYFTLLTTRYGGHVGFNSTFNKRHNLWLEKRVLTFIKTPCTARQ